MEIKKCCEYYKILLNFILRNNKKKESQNSIFLQECKQNSIEISKYICNIYSKLQQDITFFSKYTYKTILMYKWANLVNKHDKITEKSIITSFDLNNKYGTYIMVDLNILFDKFWFIIEDHEGLSNILNKIYYYASLYKRKSDIIHKYKKISSKDKRNEYIAMLILGKYNNKKININTIKNKLDVNNKYQLFLYSLLKNENQYDNIYIYSNMEGITMNCIKYNSDIVGSSEKIKVLLGSIIDENENLKDDYVYKCDIAKESSNIVDMLINNFENQGIKSIHDFEKIMTKDSVFDIGNKLKGTMLGLNTNLKNTYNTQEKKIKAADVALSILPAANKLMEDIKPGPQSEFFDFINEFSSGLQSELKSIKNKIKNGATSNNPSPFLNKIMNDKRFSKFIKNPNFEKK